MDDSSLPRIGQGVRTLPTIWPSQTRVSPRPVPAPPVKAPVPEKPTYSRTTSSEGVLLMEQKLREALDRASFECAVVRIENGIYNFGPNVCAVVELTPENEVMACHQDVGEWSPIGDFILSLAQRSSTSASTSWGGPPPSSGGSKASPVDTTVSGSQGATASDAPSGERRLFGPPAKAAQQPYAPLALGTPVPMPSTLSSGAVSSTSPRRVAPLVQGNAAAAVPKLGGGRQAAGSTPERVRMPGQPSPSPGYPGGQLLAPGAAGSQSGGQRMLMTPNSGGALRYGAMLSPGRQAPSSAPAPVYQQGLLSPRQG